MTLRGQPRFHERVAPEFEVVYRLYQGKVYAVFPNTPVDYFGSESLAVTFSPGSFDLVWGRAIYASLVHRSKRALWAERKDLAQAIRELGLAPVLRLHAHKKAAKYRDRLAKRGYKLGESHPDLTFTIGGQL